MKKEPFVTAERSPIEVVLTDPQRGLNADQVKLREEKGWTNGQPQKAGRSEKEIILSKLLTFFNLVFLLLAAFLAIAGSPVKNMTFMIVVVCNIAIGIFQELRAKWAVDKLTLVAAAQLRTVREGKVTQVRSDLLVRDDIVEFAPGNQICADGLLLTGSLQVNEALVTGEEDLIEKNPGDTLLSGSFVVTGVGRARLTRVGADSFAAKLAAEAKADPKAAKSEMMTALDKLIRIVGIGLVPVGIVLFCQEFFLLELGFRGSAEGTVSALVGMIPEGLYLLTSVAMAVSALKLTRQKVLVQDLNCIETLARVDVLCLDKTGTITEDKMEVENVIPLTDDDPEHLERVMAEFYALPEPENDTARAMREVFAGKPEWTCLRRIPFTSETKWTAAVFRQQGAFVVGALENVMGRRYPEIQELVEEWAAQGFRVLLVSEYAGEPDRSGLRSGMLRPLALVLLTNRIRPEAKKTFAYFASQGVKIKVISGDDPITASRVAQRVGIPDGDFWVNTRDLQTDEDFEEAVSRYTVFGRVVPEKKRKLIRALKKLGHTVAMTGDGVNDVLAMKEADCAVAMASGSQAASQVSQLVLTNSDFSAMPGIVGEGRRVINNIQRAAALFLVKNIFSVGLALLALITGWAYPLVPIHLTMVAALTIGAPSFVLAMEPNYSRIQGRFLPGVLRKALPGALTDIIMVGLAMAFMNAFDLPLNQISTVCTFLLATVGMLVLFVTCKPFTKLRIALMILMGLGIGVCFLGFGSFFEFQTPGSDSALVMAVLALLTPSVFMAMQFLFSRLDRLKEKLTKGKKTA